MIAFSWVALQSNSGENGRHFALALALHQPGSAAGHRRGHGATWHECYKSYALLSISVRAVTHS
ncbi:MAG: hypothetical protein R2838_24820, partial [Caldilineaceae bacterium]